jgi:hypothetical protein
MWSGWEWVRMTREISSGFRPAFRRYAKMAFSDPATPQSIRVIPPGVQIRKTVTVRATAPVGARTMNGIRTG